MHKMLSGDGDRRTVVLQGLGGIGKTQLTVSYAKRYKHKYSAIIWLYIKDENSLKQSFIRVAKQTLLEHSSASQLSRIDMKEKKTLDEVIDAIKTWLSLPNNTRWLMVYDNYDNPKLASNTDPAAIGIREHFPESYQGSIFITTRSLQVNIGHRISITKINNLQDSLKILSNASNREGLVTSMFFSRFSIIALTSILEPEAIRLAEELDGLPLALATAGAYLNQVAVDFSDYLRLYKESWGKLQKSSPELSSYEDRTLYSTWQISFDYIKQRNEHSAKLLYLWAYFDNQDLWFELLRHGGLQDPAWIRELTEDELNFHAAAGVLSDHGLVEIETASQELVESRGYSIHSCVHSWTIDVLNQEWDYDMARLALKCVGSHVPYTQDRKWWITQRRLLQHAFRCSYIVSKGMEIYDGIEWALENIGRLYMNQGKLGEAEDIYQRALRGQEKALGPNHTSILSTIHDFGNLYKRQGKLDEAEKMYHRSARTRKGIRSGAYINTYHGQQLGQPLQRLREV
jgi:tetratricopeptide (TPR) repeat protein